MANDVLWDQGLSLSLSKFSFCLLLFWASLLSFTFEKIVEWMNGILLNESQLKTYQTIAQLKIEEKVKLLQPDNYRYGTILNHRIKNYIRLRKIYQFYRA